MKICMDMLRQEKDEVQMYFESKKIILITALGTITATSIVQELEKDREKYYIIGADINPANQIATSKDVDEFYVFPSSIADQDKYRNFVLNFCKEHNVKYLFPVIDEEVVDYSMHREEFQKIGVKLCIPNEKMIKTCHYKNQFASWVEKSIPKIAIRTYDSNHAFQKEEFPVFIKPIEGRASNGCRIIHDLDELKQVENIEDYVIQSYQTGDIVTVDIMRNAAHNQLQMVQRKELLRNKNGCGIAVETICDKQLEGICTELAEKLDLNGVVNAEFFINENDIKIIEVNPRFSAGSLFSYLAGCNLAKNALHIVNGEPCELEKLNLGKHYARRYETYEL